MGTLKKNLAAVVLVAVCIFGTVWLAGQAIDEGTKDNGSVIDNIN